MGKDRRRKGVKGGSLPRFDSGKCKGSPFPARDNTPVPCSRDGLAPAAANESAGNLSCIAKMMGPPTEAPTEAAPVWK